MLKPMKKLDNKTKAEKELEASDKFQQSADQVTKKIQDNKEVYLKYVYYVAIVAALFFAYLNYQTSVEEDANSLFGIAMIDYNNQQMDKARIKFEEVLLDYDGTEAAGRANYFLGKIYFEQNTYQQALDYYLAYDGSDPLFKPAALAGAALCFELQKDFVSAADYYEQASNNESRVQQSLNYKLSSALNFERASDPDNAKRLLQEILDSDVEFDDKDLVELKLGLL